MHKASIHAEAEQEVLRYRWIESETAGRDLGEEADRRWIRLHWWGFLRACRLEHLHGKRYWTELETDDFGLMRREFRDHALLLDRIFDRLQAGQENLNVITWALGWGIPMDSVLEVLTALDYNGRRPAGPADRFDAPVVTLDPAWLAWQDGTVTRLARCIAIEGDFDALPLLADALEDAGRADVAILDHCRSGGPHTAGSRVVNRILRDS